jgi:hypothetical protein
MGYKIVGQAVTIWTSSPSFSRPEIWFDDLLAQLRYNPSKRAWRLYSPARGQKWFLHTWVTPKRRLKTVLRELDRDRAEIFWLGALASLRGSDRRPPRGSRKGDARVLYLPQRHGGAAE